VSLRERKEIQEMLRWRVVRLLPIFILLFWLIMMGWLARRTGLFERIASPTSPENRGSEVSLPTDDWYGIYAPQDLQVGFLNLVSIPGMREGEEGVQVRVSCRMDLMFLGTEADITVLGSAWLSKTQGLTEADVRIRSQDVEWRVEAQAKGDTVDVQIHTGGEKLPFVLPASSFRSVWNPNTIAGFDLPDLHPGEETTVETLDPFSMGTTRARVKCLGEEEVNVLGRSTHAKVFSIEMNAMMTRAWVAQDFSKQGKGEIIQLELPVGLLLKKIRPEDALVAPTAEAKESLFHLAAIRPSGLTPTRGARRMVLQVSGVPSGMMLPADDTQNVQGDGRVVVRQLDPPQQDGVRPVGGPEWASALESDVLVQTGHPVIQQTVKDILGEEPGIWSSALRIYEWVWENIQKEMVPSIPSALEVLESRVGDCNEHTVLFAALARSAGIPTRICLGLVWSEENQGFYYHAWPEVCVVLPNGSSCWYWMDPTLGQPIADATHIKLASGGVRDWFSLLPFMGRLEIDVLELE